MCLGGDVWERILSILSALLLLIFIYFDFSSLPLHITLNGGVQVSPFREMLLKIQWDTTTLLLEWEINNRQGKNPWEFELLSKGNSCTLLRGMENGTVIIESSVAHAYQMKCILTVQPRNLSSRYLPKINENSMSTQWLTLMFTVASLIITKNWNQYKVPLTGEDEQFKVNPYNKKLLSS